MKINTLIASLLLLASTAAISAPVTLSSEWKYGPHRQETWFTILFTYDDAALDSKAGPDVGVFLGSVLDIKFTCGGENWSFDAAKPNSITLHTTHKTAMNTFQLVGGIVNEKGWHSDFGLIVEAGRFSRDSLTVVADEIVMQFGQLYLSAGPDSPYTKVAEGRDPFTVVPQVPLPAGIYLMSSSLLGLVALGRRSKKRAARGLSSNTL